MLLDADGQQGWQNVKMLTAALESHAYPLPQEVCAQALIQQNYGKVNEGMWHGIHTSDLQFLTLACLHCTAITFLHFTDSSVNLLWKEVLFV